MNDQMPNVEQIIAGMRDETIREIGKDTISAAAQVAWYWSYIGALDMAQQLGLIDDTRRQELYHGAETFKPVCEVRAVQPGDYLAAAEMSTEQNYNQIDGVINNEAPKPPSVLDTLHRCQEDAGRSQGWTAPPVPAVTRRGEAMQLTNIERETIINFNEAERTASVYTCNEALKRQLLELCRSHPDQVCQTAGNADGGLTFELNCPKSG